MDLLSPELMSLCFCRCDGKTSQADPTDEPHPRGYKIADLGIKPKLQAEVGLLDPFIENFD